MSPIDMAHTSRNKTKLLNRINRIRGQLNGIAKALEEDRDCGEVLLTLASCRGAMNSLMAEILEGHIRFHLLPADAKPGSEETDAAEELIAVINRYLK
jgi:FrmR/RcnR family transcriptional regulator, repressor of frmRAB operon